MFIKSNKIIVIDNIIDINILKWGATVVPENTKQKADIPPEVIAWKIIDEVLNGAGESKWRLDAKISEMFNAK